ncbi:MAG: M20 family metallo-hydrolase [Ignavibacteria bacterium]|nr:M20 family metallo-hydrolase [Ignavibacteria bacterium]
MNLDKLSTQAVALLRTLISTPSFSKSENETASVLQHVLRENGVAADRHLNNVWAKNLHYNSSKPTLLLNSHHDTVKPNAQYTRNPFEADIHKGRLYGLGSNDAGASVVALMACFLYFYGRENLAFNIVFAATAEEEISGANGIECLLPLLGTIDFGIVGEPTGMNIAVAEKGLLVLDCEVKGASGHAARSEGVNAIHKAMVDLKWFRDFKFPLVSEVLGPVVMSVTMIQAGTQHNVVPDSCKFTVDVRTTDVCGTRYVLKTIQQHVACSVQPRSLRINPSAIDKSHPLVKVGQLLGCELYGSPTTSDQALMPFPTIKMGPGESARSHTADEFVLVQEVESGIQQYIDFLATLHTHYETLARPTQ